MHPCMFPSAIVVCNQLQSGCKRIFNSKRYRSINFYGIDGYPNVIPPKIRDKLPKFNGTKCESTNKHLQEFKNLMDDYEVHHEVIIMRLFVQSLKGDVRD